MKTYNDYFYPDTDVLKNNLGIRDSEHLAEAEAKLSAFRMREPIPQGADLTAEGLKNTHHHIFQDIYPFAGEFRDVSMVKSQGVGEKGIEFASGSHVDRVEIPRFYGQLQHDLKAGAFDSLDKETFANRSSIYLADLNYIHPFPEGNGRTQRLFLENLADRSGYKFDHQAVTRKDWIDASIESYNNDWSRVEDTSKYGPHEKMTQLIADTCKASNLDQDRSSVQVLDLQKAQGVKDTAIAADQQKLEALQEAKDNQAELNKRAEIASDLEKTKTDTSKIEAKDSSVDVTPDKEDFSNEMESVREPNDDLNKDKIEQLDKTTPDTDKRMEAALRRQEYVSCLEERQAESNKEHEGR